MAIPAAHKPGPLVTSVGGCLVARVDSTGLLVGRWMQCAAGHRLHSISPSLSSTISARNGAIIELERLDGDLRRVDVFDAVGLPERGSARWRADFDSAARTLAWLRHKQRRSRVAENVSRDAAQNPNPLSPTVRTAAVIRRLRP